MNPSDLCNFFAIIDSGSGDEMRKLSLESNLQKEISGTFYSQLQSFMSYSQEIEFDGGYRPSKGEVLKITSYKIPDHISSAQKNPIGAEEIKKKDLENASTRLKAIFAIPLGQKDEIIFQGMTAASRLSPNRLHILLSRQTFSRLNHPGVTVQDSVSAVITKSKLLFASFGKVKTFLDVSEHYAEATDEQIDLLFTSMPIVPEDKDAFTKSTDTFVRKKIYGIVKKETLTEFSPEQIKSAAKTYDIDISIEKKGNKAKIVLPMEKKELKNVLRFLDEDILESKLSRTVYLSNSKRPFDP